jgi:hypothetical protein
MGVSPSATGTQTATQTATNFPTPSTSASTLPSPVMLATVSPVPRIFLGNLVGSTPMQAMPITVSATPMPTPGSYAGNGTGSIGGGYNSTSSNNTTTTSSGTGGTMPSGGGGSYYGGWAIGTSPPIPGNGEIRYRLSFNVSSQHHFGSLLNSAVSGSADGAGGVSVTLTAAQRAHFYNDLITRILHGDGYAYSGGNYVSTLTGGDGICGCNASSRYDRGILRVMRQSLSTSLGLPYWSILVHGTIVSSSVSTSGVQQQSQPSWGTRFYPLVYPPRMFSGDYIRIYSSSSSYVNYNNVNMNTFYAAAKESDYEYLQAKADLVTSVEEITQVTIVFNLTLPASLQIQQASQIMARCAGLPVQQLFGGFLSSNATRAIGIIPIQIDGGIVENPTAADLAPPPPSPSPLPPVLNSTCSEEVVASSSSVFDQKTVIITSSVVGVLLLLSCCCFFFFFFCPIPIPICCRRRKKRRDIGVGTSTGEDELALSLVKVGIAGLDEKYSKASSKGGESVISSLLLSNKAGQLATIDKKARPNGHRASATSGSVDKPTLEASSPIKASAASASVSPLFKNPLKPRLSIMGENGPDGGKNGEEVSVFALNPMLSSKASGAAAAATPKAQAPGAVQPESATGSGVGGSAGGNRAKAAMAPQLASSTVAATALGEKNKASVSEGVAPTTGAPSKDSMAIRRPSRRVTMLNFDVDDDASTEESLASGKASSFVKQAVLNPLQRAPSDVTKKGGEGDGISEHPEASAAAKRLGFGGGSGSARETSPEREKREAAERQKRVRAATGKAPVQDEEGPEGPGTRGPQATVYSTLSFRPSRPRASIAADSRPLRFASSKLGLQEINLDEEDEDDEAAAEHAASVINNAVAKASAAADATPAPAEEPSQPAAAAPPVARPARFSVAPPMLAEIDDNDGASAPQSSLPSYSAALESPSSSSAAASAAAPGPVPAAAPESRGNAAQRRPSSTTRGRLSTVSLRSPLDTATAAGPGGAARMPTTKRVAVVHRRAAPVGGGAGASVTSPEEAARQGGESASPPLVGAAPGDSEGTEGAATDAAEAPKKRNPRVSVVVKKEF